MKTFDSIQDMILEHIANIDGQLRMVEDRPNSAQLLQAKSQALLALAELKGASR